MKLPRPLSVYWLLLTALLVWALVLHGQQFGGVKWLVHVGRGWSAALQSALAKIRKVLVQAILRDSNR